MKIDVNSMLTLNNKEKYAVLEKISDEDINYYYIALINDEETDIKDEYKIIKVNETNGINSVIEITDEDLLKKILPMFFDKMPA